MKLSAIQSAIRSGQFLMDCQVRAKAHIVTMTAAGKYVGLDGDTHFSVRDQASR